MINVKTIITADRIAYYSKMSMMDMMDIMNG